ncbi:cytochrome P450 CYP72A219-like [Olea europaea subsp. europaea]|uniref:Cytochrome P450 CYP72A219-like n=1 Tax=Olea europaea subsp. europaea TaxID=158383 RepID=A0A8S0RIQ1_OLEEU|nr:cytochrome P450 CYP72A219-like [Olea europaea subsp. europaea]
MNLAGKKAFVWAGLRPKVFIMEPDHMKTIFFNHSTFQKNFKVTNSVVQELITGIIRFEGEEWSKRRTIMSPKFQLEKLKQMIPLVLKCSDQVIIEWKKLVSNSKDGSYTLDVCHDIEELISGVTSQFLFGIDYAKDKEIFHLITQLSELTKQATKVSNLPGSKFLPTETNRKSKRLTKELHQRLYKLMCERKKAIKEGKVVEDNVFNMLLESEIANNQDEMIGHMKGFVFNSHDTTAFVLVWNLILLCIYSEWQDRAREEVFRVFGNRRPDYEGLSQLKVLPMFMNEVLRLYPPLVELSRFLEEEIKLGEYTLPADIQVIMPTILVHRDPEFWGEDANEFKPERFAEGVLKATNGQAVFFPFAWGPRICIGYNMALLQVKLVLADLLRNFSFEISPTYEHAPRVVFTQQPQYGAPIILRNLN